MRKPPFKMLAVGAVAAFVFIGCEVEKPAADGAPVAAPEPPAELTNDITVEEVASSDQIVFSSYKDSGTTMELYRMNSNGSGLTRLTNDLQAQSAPSWSWDGATIVHKCEGAICAIGPDGRDSTVIYNGAGVLTPRDPALSQNGKLVAFSALPATNKGTWDIFVYNLETGVLTNLTQTPNVEDYTPAWHPLGGLAWSQNGKIVYNSGDSDEVFTLSDESVLNAMYPDFTSDGLNLVYQGSVGGDGPRDIFLTDLDDVVTTKLTQTETVGDYTPSISPDDTKIVYTRKDQLSDGDEEVYVMNLDGSGVSRRTFNDHQEENPDWGMPVVTVSMGDDVTQVEGSPPATTTPFEFDVELSQAATSNVTVAYAVTGVSASIPGDVTSTSGTLTFTSGQKTKTITVVVAADDVAETAESFKVTLSNPTGSILGDAEARGVIEDDDEEPSPSPTPSASPSASPSPVGLSTAGQIAWTSDQNGDYDIWVKGRDGSNIRHVTSSVDAEMGPDFSPDGDTIVFYGGPGAPDIYWVPSSGSAGPTKIQGGSDADVTPTWSPDGSKVAWASLGGSVNLVYATPPNGSPALLHDSEGDESYPDWHTLHNGDEAVVFQVQDADDNFSMKMFNRTTGALTDLGSGKHPEISPDGRTLAFADGADGSHDIYTLDLTTSGAARVRLTTATGDDTTPSWSPDGTSIAFTSHRDGNAEIYLMTKTGAQQTNFTNRPADDFEPSWGSLPASGQSAPVGEGDRTNPNRRPDSSQNTKYGALIPLLAGSSVAARRLLRRRHRTNP